MRQLKVLPGTHHLKKTHSGAQCPRRPQTHKDFNLCLLSQRILCTEFAGRQNGGRVLS